MRSRECRGKRVRCERLPASGDLKPSLEYYKALPHYYSPLHDKPPLCCMDVGDSFVHVCLCGLKYCFSSPLVNPCEHSSLYLHASGSSVHPQTKGLQCLSPNIEHRNAVLGRYHSKAEFDYLSFFTRMTCFSSAFELKQMN